MRSIHTMAYRIRGILMVPPFLFMLLFSSGETEWDRLTWPVGLTLFGAGLGLRIWAQMHLHYRLNEHKKLTMTGPYSRVRNPIYIANTTMLVGLAFTSELVWFAPVMLLWCAMVYRFVTRHEESHLIEKYGASYEQYLASVPRWRPRPAQRMGAADARGFFWPSVVAELHCLLLLLPLVGKETFSGLV